MWTAPGICPVSYSKISSFDSTMRMPSSLRCFSSQSVSTSVSGCAYCVGCVAIREKNQGAFRCEQEVLCCDTVACGGVILTYIARKPRRRQQLLKLTPAFLRLLFRAAALLDVTAHHVFAKIVVDDVAAVLFDKSRALFRPLLIHKRVFLQPSRGCVRIDLAVHITAGRLVRAVIQFLHQILHRIKFLRALWINSRCRKQHCSR